MKTKTFNLHHLNKKIRPVASNWLIFVLIFMLFFGVILGSFIVKSENNVLSMNLVKAYSLYSDINNCSGAGALFFRIFLFTSCVITLIYFTGLCAVGIPFVSIIPFAAGAFAGIVAGYYYKSLLLKGLGYCMIIFFPAMTVFAVSVLLACKESIIMSHNMLCLLSMRHTQPNVTFKSYSLKYMIYIALGGLSSVIFAVLSRFFIRLF